MRVVRQSAALCYRVQRGTPQVLLITTRGSGRWIIPKGNLIEGLSPSGTASQEAWEEAGVTGTCTPNAFGQFLHYKRRYKKGSAVYLVDVYPLVVKSLAARYPEWQERKRRWFSLGHAASRVNSPDLASLLRNVEHLYH
nr:NUDIX hydrolase [Ruegeria faecimaris]